MRSVILGIVLLTGIALSSPATAQIRKIPAVVTDAFKYKYRNAESVEWKDKLSHFVVYFQLNGDKYEAYFKNDGTWNGSQKEITRDDLPEDVLAGLDKSKYADWEIIGYYELIQPSDKLEYRLLVSKSDLNKRDLTFTEKGRLVRDKLTL
ncbi:PepSY-like domain-containing protein [Flavihumibacter sp. UBA7668]|uniref:PepSY-like domain-containing protein n=1 Tax=Flavihumibacter sp. UBA7668 TaxID=1946542 RepID=UPI0025BD647D|nr:PepSY-like domain-containing protein [Flavihumibacter sp. UBA7668]